MNHYIVNYEIMYDQQAVQWGNLSIIRESDSLMSTYHDIRNSVYRTVHCEAHPGFQPRDVRIIGVFKL